MRKKQELTDILRKHLADFPIFQTQRHRVSVHQFPDSGVFSIGYRTTPDNIPVGTTHFDLNIIDNICYLLHIELDPRERRRGRGKMLYQIIENFAREAGCTSVRMTASGKTPRGEPREKYMERLGYKGIKTGEMEKLL